MVALRHDVLRAHDDHQFTELTDVLYRSVEARIADLAPNAQAREDAKLRVLEFLRQALPR